MVVDTRQSKFEVRDGHEIETRGDVVFIDGQGFSVASDLQDKFVSQQIRAGGGGGGRQLSNREIRAIRLQQEMERRSALERARPEAQRQLERARQVAQAKRQQAINVARKRAERIERGITRDIDRLRRERERLKVETIKRKGIAKVPEKVSRELTLGALVTAQTIGEAGQSFITLPKAIPKIPSASAKVVKTIIKDPKSVVRFTKSSAKKIKAGGKNFWELAKISPTTAIARVGTEILILKGTGKAVKVTGKVSAKSTAKVSKLLKGTKVSGKEIIVKVPSSRKVTAKITKAGRISKVKVKTKPTELKLKKVGTTAREPLSKQVSLAGKSVTAVSGQANALVKTIRRKKVIRKPLFITKKVGKKTYAIGEKNFPKRLKTLLKKFDDKTISSKELIELNKRVPILERSFFADPRARIRLGRLGLSEKDATLRDIIKGNFQIRKNKPQVLVFPKAKIQKFPKALKDIEKKLKANKPLTKSQGVRYYKFMIKKSGKFKPVGFLTRESEITLAPDEIIKKVRTLARIEEKGRLIPIVEAKVVKASKSTKKLLKKARKGEISRSEIRTLKSKLRKESRGLTTASRRTKVKPRLRIAKLIPRLRRRPKKLTRGVHGVGALGRPRVRGLPRTPRARRTTRTGRVGRTGRGGGKRTGRVRRTGRGVRVSRTGRTARGGRVARTLPRPPPRIIPRIKLKKKARPELRKVKRGYDVWVRPLKKRKGRRPKLVKINKVPLTKTRAMDYRNYLIDTSLARSGRIKEVAGKGTRGKLRVPTDYARRTSKKFRRIQVIKGKPRRLPKGKVIERSKHLLDTKPEKRKITLAKRLKQLKRRSKKR